MKEPIELYRTGGLAVKTWPEEEEGHKLYIGDSEYVLMRGILKELAVTPYPAVGKLNIINPEILIEADRQNFSLAEIMLAFSQARIKELEGEVSSAYSELIAQGE